MTLDRKDYKSAIPQLEKRISALEKTEKKSLAQFNVLSASLQKEILKREQADLKTNTMMDTITVKMFYQAAVDEPLPDDPNWSETFPDLKANDDGKKIWYKMITYKGGKVLNQSPVAEVQLMQGVFTFVDSVANTNNGNWTTVNGGAIQTGIIKATLTDNYFNLNDGSFQLWSSQTNKGLKWNGSQLQITGEISTSSNFGNQGTVSDTLTTLGEKKRIFYSQPTPPYDKGDMWVNATYNSGGVTYSDDILRCNTAKASGGSFAISDWQLASNYTDDTVANNKADKSAAVTTTVSVYYRSTTHSAPSISTSTSIGTSASTDNAWEYVMPEPKRDRYFYTCEKYVHVDNSVSFSTVRELSSETYASKWVHASDNTYIDGGKLYANSVTATQIKTDTITVGSLYDGADYETAAASHDYTDTQIGKNITVIDADGITVHAENNPGTDYTGINARGFRVVSNAHEVASLGTDGCDVRTPEGITGFRVASCGALQSRSISYALNDQITTTAKTYYIKDISNLTNGSSIIAVFNNFGSYLYSATMTFTKGTSETKTATKNSITITGTYDGDGTFTFKTNTSTAWINNISYDAVCHDTSISLRGKVLTDGSWFTESKKVLWTNSNPTSNFASQTVLANNTELGACDFLEIYWYLNSSGRQFCTRVEFGMDGRLFFYGNGNYGYREVSSSASGVVFDVGHYNNNNTSNGYCIPGMIIGIRKV